MRVMVNSDRKIYTFANLIKEFLARLNESEILGGGLIGGKGDESSYDRSHSAICIVVLECVMDTQARLKRHGALSHEIRVRNMGGGKAKILRRVTGFLRLKA